MDLTNPRQLIEKTVLTSFLDSALLHESIYSMDNNIGISSLFSI
jgi:hypothetical protein